MIGSKTVVYTFDIFVVGDDWTGKYDYLKELGVQVVYFPYRDGISSSNLKKKFIIITKNYKRKLITIYHLMSKLLIKG